MQWDKNEMDLKERIYKDVEWIHPKSHLGQGPVWDLDNILM
jgi:hypothetical protein